MKFQLEGSPSREKLNLKPELRLAMEQFVSWFGTANACFNYMDTTRKGFVLSADFTKALTSVLSTKKSIKLKTLDAFEIFNVLLKHNRDFESLHLNAISKQQWHTLFSLFKGQ